MGNERDLITGIGVRSGVLECVIANGIRRTASDKGTLQMNKKTKPLKSFTIDRSKWACESNNRMREEDSALRSYDGYKCCLGFMASACGIEEITNRGTLEQLDPKWWSKLPISFRPRDCNDSDTVLTLKAIRVNDHEKNNNKRELGLKKIFKEAGITVKFVGKYCVVEDT